MSTSSCPTRWWVSTACACLLVALVGRPARADNKLLARARAQLDALDYPTARATLERALATGTNTPAELVDIYRLTGIVTGALGDTEASTVAFEHLLALSPKAKLEDGTSPKITKQFAAAAESFQSREPLKVTAEVNARDSSATLTVSSDPLGMVMSAKVELSADDQPEQTLTASGRAPITIPLPTSGTLKLRMSALDLFGNELVVIRDLHLDREPEKVVAPRATATITTTTASERPLYAKWWLWGGVAVAVGATGMAFGLAARSDQHDLDAIRSDSANHRYAEATAIESRLSSHALEANLALGAAGVAAIAAVYLFVTEPRAAAETKPDFSRTAIAPVPLRGGAGIALTRPF
jgi:hypothetical protein